MAACPVGAGLRARAIDHLVEPIDALVGTPEAWAAGRSKGRPDYRLF